MYILEGMRSISTMITSIHLKLQQSSICMLYEVACMGAHGMPEMNISLLPRADDTAAMRERLAVAPSHISFTQKKQFVAYFRSMTFI